MCAAVSHTFAFDTKPLTISFAFVCKLQKNIKFYCIIVTCGYAIYLHIFNFEYPCSIYMNYLIDWLLQRRDQLQFNFYVFQVENNSDELKYNFRTDARC